MNNKLKLDILPLDTHNVQTLGLADISYYPQGLGVVSPTIEIFPPTYNKVVQPFAYRSVTIYNSNILGLTCTDEDCDLIDLPDGVWKVKYSIAPAYENFVEKTFMRTEKIQQLWGEAFLSVDLFCKQRPPEALKAELDDIWYLIQGAIADANECNEIAAMNKYRLAMSMLKAFKQNQC